MVFFCLLFTYILDFQPAKNLFKAPILINNVCLQ